jgi:hypothetical protein
MQYGGSDICYTLKVMEPISVILPVDCIQALPSSNVHVEVIHSHFLPIFPISVYNHPFISFDTTYLTSSVVLSSQLVKKFINSYEIKIVKILLNSNLDAILNQLNLINIHIPKFLRSGSSLLAYLGLGDPDDFIL